MSVFKKAGYVHLRGQRFQYFNDKIRLMFPVENVSKENVVADLTGKARADRELSEVVQESKEEIIKIISQNSKGVDARYIEALQNGTGVWLNKNEKIHDICNGIPEEVVIAADGIRLLNSLGEEAENIDDTLRGNCPDDKYIEFRTVLMQAIGAAFEAGRVTERGIALLLLPDAIKGQKFKRSKNELLIEAKAAAIERKKELIKKGYSPTKANGIIQLEFENMAKYKELFKDYGVVNWKKFLQESKNGKTR